MFRSVLIANRGEIALRIARACEGLGIEPVMVFSEADRDAPWLDAANRTLCLGGARPAASYLDANAVLQAWLASGVDWKHHRAVVFLDPYGMQVPWSTIELLASTKAIEAIINFPGMAVQRLLTKSGDIPERWQMLLDAFFGSPDWRQLAYEKSSDLFGPMVTKVSGAEIKLLQWYRRRLRTIFGHVSTARLIKNTRGNPLYYLIWAGPHKKGLDGAEHILSKGERVKR